jgi:hypothetical protein
MAHIAVIGAGPCGILATKLLLERGFKVTLFESGNMHEEVHITQSDYNFDSPSKLPVDVHKVGGGSNYWKARVGGLSDEFLERQTSAGNALFPFSIVEFKKYLSLLYKEIGLSEQLDVESLRSVHSCKNCTPFLSKYFWHFIRQETFKDMFTKIVDNPNLTLTSEAYCVTVKYLEAVKIDSPRVVEVNFMLSGETALKSQTFNHVIITAGCLQSTALVLRSFPEYKSYGAGNFLMEHFDGYIGKLYVSNKNTSCLSNLSLNTERKLENSKYGIGISKQKRDEYSWHLELAPLTRTYVFDPVQNRFNIRRNSLLKSLFFFERLMTHHWYKLNAKFCTLLGIRAYSLWLKGEDLPNFNSTISQQYDGEKGRYRIFYRHKTSLETRKRLGQELREFGRQIKKANLGKLKLSPWTKIPKFTSTGGNWHPMGSLRTGYPESGVLDRNLSLGRHSQIQVFDSSSFPSGGHHNPTTLALVLTVYGVEKICSISKFN